MIRNILIGFAVVFFLFVTAMIAAFYYWGWWGLLAVLVVMMTCSWLAQKFFFRFFVWVMTRPFRQKGRTLRGATIEVHSVQPTSADDIDVELDDDEAFDEEDEIYDGVPGDLDEDDAHRSAARTDGHLPAEKQGELDFPEYYHGPRDYFQVDLTISPIDHSDGSAPWYPSALSLTPAEQEDAHYSRSTAKIAQRFDGSCELLDLEFWRDGSFHPFDDEDDVEQNGSQRVRMLVGVRPNVETLRLLYFFEDVGQIRLTTIIDASG